MLTELGALGPELVDLRHRIAKADSQDSACSPTSLTAQARASERDRATPASTRVSSTCRSGCRSRVITGTDKWVNSARPRRARAPGDLAAVARLGLLGDLHPGVPGLGAEAADPALGLAASAASSANVPTTTISSRSTVT